MTARYARLKKQRQRERDALKIQKAIATISRVVPALVASGDLDALMQTHALLADPRVQAILKGKSQ
jgi:hypothetical protein